VHFRRQLYHVPTAHDGREALLAQDCAVWLELGMNGTLTSSDASSPASPLRVASLNAGEDDVRSLLRALAALYANGVELDLAAVDAPYARRRVSLPPYPFERERHWLDLPKPQPAEGAASVASTRAAPASAASAPSQPVSRPVSSHPLITRMRVHSTLESDIAPADTDGDERRDATG